MDVFRKSLFILGAGMVVALLLSGCRRTVPVGETPEPVSWPMGFCPDSLSATGGTVGTGETLAALLVRLGAGQSVSASLVQACDTVFDVRKLRAGNHYDAYYEGDSLRYLVYEQDRIARIIFRCTDSLSVWRYERPVERQVKAVDIPITSSLWNDLRRVDVSPLLIVSLEDVYEWSVDFFGLQEGDRFRALYSQCVCEDEVVAVDSLWYAEFIRDGKELPAVFFDPGDGSGRYWAPDGASLKKAFLKAPLQFTRISSGFSYHRRHPVSGKVKPHTAVDYAAPTGTPVRAIGNGTVLSAGWAGGGGNTVKIKHNGVYTSAYLHLSRFAKGIRAGVHVAQGQVIGYVGSTGVSTGPHLDFRVWKNGTPVNPLTLVSPPSEPLAKVYLPALDSVARRYRHHLDSLLETTPSPLDSTHTDIPHEE